MSSTLTKYEFPIDAVSYQTEKDGGEKKNPRLYAGGRFLKQIIADEKKAMTSFCAFRKIKKKRNENEN